MIGNMGYFILGACLVIILIKYVKLKLSIKNINRQIRFIYDRDTCVQIENNVNNRHLKEIINIVNSLKNKYLAMEDDLRKKDKLFRETVTNMSHDLRTPLAITTGYLQMLEDENLTDEQEGYVNIAKDRMKYLKDLLEQMFEFVRIEADEIKLEFKIVNLFNILRDTLAMFYDEYEKMGGIQCIDIPNEACFVLGDKNAIMRIISNVISNSLTYGDGKFSILANIKHKTCIIKIENSTRCIEKKDINFIFNRLYTTYKSRNSGRTGLGLAIAKKMIELHNGEITAEYEENTHLFSVILKFPITSYDQLKD